MQKNNWNFDNTYANLPKHFYTKQNPTSVRSPELVVFNEELAESLGVPYELGVFAGNVIPQGAEPISQAYAGHQFGYFTMLGDGRAIVLGEQVTSSGDRFDIQLKGSGRTPYSRNGDGMAALGPMLREYIISEAMHNLKILTTRSLTVVETGEVVLREMERKGAILTRVASSHIRVGTFEYARLNSIEDVRRLADYTIKRHFPNLAIEKDKYLFLLKEVIKRQASLISQWQLVGFIHGVMNTDNMAISGETIDYGPCAFMDVYNPKTVFSSIDTQGRYSYENQPKIAVWNLARFAETLLPLLHDDENKSISIAQEELDKFQGIYQRYYLSGMRAKLGLFDEDIEDNVLVNELLQLMQQYKADYTNTFRTLTLDITEDSKLFASLHFQYWKDRWRKRHSQQNKSKDEVKALMKNHNPNIIPRNHLVEEALNFAESGDLTKFEKLLFVLRSPYDYTAEQEEYSKFQMPVNCSYQTFCGT